MKEIKFRAWNDIDKMMIDWAALKVLPVFFANIIKGKVNHHELMQFTGLKDKNGIDIYEGDIVKLEVAYNCDFEYKNPRNAFNHNTKTAKIKISFVEGCFVLDSGKIPDDNQMIWLWDELEIIGNIHKNPELIND